MRNKDKIFIVDGDTQLTFEAVAKLIMQYADYLRQRNIKSNSRVAIFMDRGWQSLIAIYAVLYCGAIYIAIDSKMPSNKVIQLNENLLIDVVVVSNLAQGDIFNIKDIICIPRFTANHQALSTFEPAIIGNHIAAIMCSSGSTGKCKGIALSHLAIHTFATWMKNTFLTAKNDTIGSISPASFDLSLFDYFSSLQSGAKVNFIQKKSILSPRNFSNLLSKNQINIIYTVPTFLIFWLQRGGMSDYTFNHLQTILFAGEVFPVKFVKKLIKTLPNVTLYNLFGPTETNVCCYYQVDKNDLDNRWQLPIGEPTPYAQISIDDDSSELKVKGLNLFSGYVVEGKLISSLDDEGWYNTHDKVSLHKNLIEYHGRTDRLVKIDGRRVALTELESLVGTLPTIKRVAAIYDIREDKKLLVLFISSKSAINKKNIVNKISTEISSSAIPDKIIQLNALPILDNGKLDYQGMLKIIDHEKCYD